MCATKQAAAEKIQELQQASNALESQLQAAPSLDTITQLLQEKDALQQQLMRSKFSKVGCKVVLHSTLASVLIFENF